MPLRFPGRDDRRGPATARRGKRLDELAPLTQERNSWCWAACLQMILRYYGDAAVQQCELARFLFDRPCCDAPMPGACNQGAAATEQVDVLIEYGHVGTPVSGAALFDTVRAEIDADRPLTAGIERLTTRHRLVIRGWDILNGEWVDVCDPDNNGRTGQAAYLDLKNAFGGGSWYATMLDIH